MSKFSLTPNYCSCTVLRARNLVDKTKNGLDPFCTISMGKEKFVTAACEKTCSPDWHEQCDMAIVDDATIKLTVYHKTKSSLSKGDFVGRAYVSLRGLDDYDRVLTKWYKLSDKEGKSDKDRGEIEVSLQFYSKNNTTGSVLDLATKKKHLSLRDIRQSLSDKLKTASKHRRHDQRDNEDQSMDQRSNFDGDNGSGHNVRRFPDDSTSESASFFGSYTSLNSLSNPDNKQQKRKSRAPSSGIGSMVSNGTPYSSRRSIASDYEVSSILDSASMCGSEEMSSSSPLMHSQVQEQQEGAFINNNDDRSSSSNPLSKKTTKERLTSLNLRTINEKNVSNPYSLPTSRDSRPHVTITSEDVEAAFDSLDDNNKSTSRNKYKDHHRILKTDSVFGLSTIEENLNKDDNFIRPNSTKYSNDEDIDFCNISTKVNQTNDNKKSKLPFDIHQSKSIPHIKEQQKSWNYQSDDIQTPSMSIDTKTNTSSVSSTTVSNKKQINDMNDSTDEDVDELLGKFERISSMRSSVRRKIQVPKELMQPSLFENENKVITGQQQTPSNRNRTLPDIVGQPAVKGSPQITVSSGPKKITQNSLSVLGYDNVKSTPIHPKVRQELEYLDHEELLYVIAHQLEIIKRRDTRVKDLENYADGLLVKIVEQCPNILQSANINLNRKPY